MTDPLILEIGVVDVQVGRGVQVVQPANLYGCELGDEVFVGPFTEIQRNVRIGARTRIQSHTFICDGTAIGEDCFIGHGVMFVNDWLRDGPARGDRSLYGTSSLGSRVSVGSNATIMPVTICSDVVIGAGSVVTRDIVQAGRYAGSPARLLSKREVTGETEITTSS